MLFQANKNLDWKRPELPSGNLVFPLKGYETAALPNALKGPRAGSIAAGPSEKGVVWQEKAAYGFLILFIALLYITPGTLYPQLENVPISKGAIVLSFLFLFLAKKAQGASWRLADKSSLWLIAFTVVEGFSIVDALWREYALSVYLDALKQVMVYFLIVNLVNNSGKLRQILWTLPLAATFPAMGTLSRYILKTDLVGGRAAWIGIYADPNDMAYNLVVLIPVVLSLFETEKSFLLKGILVSELVIFTAAIYATGSRGGLVGLLVIIFFQVLRSQKRMLNLTIGAVLFIVLLALAPASYWERAETILKFRQDESAMGRIYAWKVGFEMAFDRPLFGGGIGCFALGWPIYAPSEAGTMWRTSHNAFVQVLGENGFLGLVTFTGFLATAIRSLQKFGRPLAARRLLAVEQKNGALPGRGPQDGPQPAGDLVYARGLEIALLGFIACGMTLGIARSWPPYLLIGLAMALCRIGAGTQGRKKNEQSSDIRLSSVYAKSDRCGLKRLNDGAIR